VEGGKRRVVTKDHKTEEKDIEKFSPPKRKNCRRGRKRATRKKEKTLNDPTDRKSYGGNNRIRELKRVWRRGRGPTRFGIDWRGGFRNDEIAAPATMKSDPGGKTRRHWMRGGVTTKGWRDCKQNRVHCKGKEP